MPGNALKRFSLEPMQVSVLDLMQAQTLQTPQGFIGEVK